MNISPAQIKELREMTGAGMMDCKKALLEVEGNFDEAVQWLRKKGVAKAERKAGRFAAEGLIAIATNDYAGVLVELNSETDFVARNEYFQNLARNIANVALLCKGDLTATEKAYIHSETTVAETIREAVVAIGENITFRRAAMLSVEKGVIGAYMHNPLVENMGSMGVLVRLETEGHKERAKAFARQVAMHVAATHPVALTVEEIDPEILSRERDIFSSQARESGKTADVVEKMVEGRMRKFFEESVLLHQKFVINQDVTVEEALKMAEKDIGAAAKLSGFVRFSLGEGTRKDEND